MKKILLYLLVVISIGINAQKYVPFPTANAQWNVFYASSYNDSPMDTTLLQYSLQGDTTINGTVYRKMCRNIGTFANPIYKSVGGLREQDKKIYYYSGYGYTKYIGSIINGSEKLLYDFNKKVGDVVAIDQWRGYPITKIDSIKIGNEYRKRYNDCIIEGIGDVNQGLLSMITDIPTCSMCHLEWHFVCFSQNGECGYKNPDYVDCNSTRSWKDIPYVPFPTENAQWNISSISSINNSSVYTTLLKYTLQGDTTIKGIIYHRICKNTGTDMKPNYKGIGGIREQNKKIFYVGESYAGPYFHSDREVLLYDFTKQVGDTVWLDKQTSSIYYNIIGTDSVKIGNEFRRRYAITRHGSTEYIVEGIGNVNSGLLSIITPIPTCLECVFEWHFVCFSQNGECVYKNPDYVDCNSTRSWKDIPYVPFPTANAQWNEFYASSYNDSPMDTTLLQYSLQGDTTINQIVYHKMCRNIGTIANPIYKSVGGLREQDKKIYYYSGYGYTTYTGSFISGSEKLLYDFNKKVGDEVAIDQWRGYPITKIDSVKIGNEYRKRYNDCIIEGIGDVNHGLLSMITDIPTCSMCHFEWHFVCFSQNGESIYKNPDYVDCNSVLKTALSDVKANIPLIKISPNPVKDILILESINTDSPFTSVEVMDIMGKSVKTTLITNSSESKLDLSDCMTGIYYVLVKYKDKTEAHKIIKI